MGFSPLPRLRPRMPCLLLAVLIAGPQAARAGAWLEPPKARYLKIGLLHTRASSRWDCRGASRPADPSGNDYVERQVFLYGEYGLRPGLTVLGSWAYKDQSIDGEPVFGTRSTGDLRLGARMGLVRAGPRPVSLEAVLSLPTYPPSDLSSPPGEREQYLPAGSGALEAELRILAGLSFYPLPLYANVDAGYRARGRQVADQWLLACEVGAGSNRSFVKIEGRWRLPVEESCEDALVGSVAASERRVEIAPEGGVRLWESIWLSLGYTHPLAGRNTLDAGQWSLALVQWTRE
jgi:hypothetical protein